MGNLGFSELAVIFVFVLLVFGPRRLPEIARTIGRALAQFRRASAELRETVEREVQADELRRSVGDVRSALDPRAPIAEGAASDGGEERQGGAATSTAAPAEKP